MSAYRVSIHRSVAQRLSQGQPPAQGHSLVIAGFTKPGESPAWLKVNRTRHISGNYCLVSNRTPEEWPRLFRFNPVTLRFEE